jgi:hypothetical protein
VSGDLAPPEVSSAFAACWGITVTIKAKKITKAEIVIHPEENLCNQPETVFIAPSL